MEQKKGGKADIGGLIRMITYWNWLQLIIKSRQHSFGGLLGYSFQSFNYESLSAGNSIFLIDGFFITTWGQVHIQNLQWDPLLTKWNGIFLRKIQLFIQWPIICWLQHCVLMVLPTFAANKNGDIFPSVALGWRFTEESFMQNLKDVISNGKLRLSFGQTGNSDIGNKATSYYQVGNNNTFWRPRIQRCLFESVG